MTDDRDRARAALGRAEIRAELRAMGEDLRVIERALTSERPELARAAIDRVREAEARLRRGPTPFTVNTRLRLYESIDQMVRRAPLQRAIAARCRVSADAATLLVDLATWGEVSIERRYEAALEELRRRGLAERRLPLARDPDQHTRAAPTPFVDALMDQVLALAVLDHEARRLAPPGAKSRRRS